MIAFIFLLVVIPLSLVCWTCSLVLYSAHNHEGGYWQPMSPWRWLLAIAVPLLVVLRGLKKKSLDLSGAIAALVVGITMMLANYCFFTSMLAFYFAGSRATKVKAAEKKRISSDYKEGGQRNWVQVVCNGGIPALLAVLYIIETGCGEYTVDFSSWYGISWLSMSLMGALASSSGDTLASELGSVFSKSDPWLITSFCRVPKGTNGGVSLVGTLCSILGGVIVGVAYYLTLLLFSSPYQLESSPPQWPIIPVAAMAGFLGSVIDSILGATFQFSGYDLEKKCIVEQETDSPTVEHISGMALLDNNGVNLLTAFFMCILTPRFALVAWAKFALK